MPEIYTGSIIIYHIGIKVEQYNWSYLLNQIGEKQILWWNISKYIRFLKTNLGMTDMTT